jgi:hypothetical protein
MRLVDKYKSFVRRSSLTGNNACGIFNRNNNTVFDQQALDALIEGGAD